MSSAESETRMVLVVDDDRAFSGALAAALRRRGLKVVVAHGHHEALTEAQAWSPDCALVDLRMPGPSGLETVARLHALAPTMRIVVLTGYGSIATAVEAVKLGAHHYLTKPAPVEQILAAFERDAGDTAAPIDERPATLDELEWEHLQRVLNETGGNVSAAARQLGIHRRSLQRKLGRGRPRPASR